MNTFVSMGSVQNFEQFKPYLHELTFLKGKTLDR